MKVSYKKLWMGKLVSRVYHKLSYIDAATSESDIQHLLKSNAQQLTLVDVSKAKNTLALMDVKNYIDMITAKHSRVSMKSLIDRFTKAPYPRGKPRLHRQGPRQQG